MARSARTTQRSTRRITRAVRILVLAVTTALAALVVATPAQAAYCGITWGSLPKTAAVANPAGDYITNVRAGQNTCYDRLVIDLGNATGYNAFDVRYVDQVRSEGQGAVVPLRGGARLAIVAKSVPVTPAGRTTYAPANRSELVSVTGYRTFRQVAWAGAFEGQTTIGLGVRARLPMRAFVLPGPAAGQVRLVIDVAHLW
jgi:hypothetical protein